MRKIMNTSVYKNLNLCPAKAGTLCGCGRCKAIIFVLATKAGIHPAALVDSLGLTIARKETPVKSRLVVARNRIAEGMTVSIRGGNQSVGTEAVVKVLTALNYKD